MTSQNSKQQGRTDTFTIRGIARLPAVVLLVAAVSLMAACATTAPATAPDNVVRERAEARWEALLSGDLEGAYAFYSPGFRATSTLVDFAITIRTRRVKWTSAEYVEKTCEGDVCKVKFNVGYQVKSPVPGLDEWNGFNATEETWINNEEEWWFLPTN